MKAAILRKPLQLEIADIPTPRPNDYQALVRMDVCGVCSGTDTHIYQGKMPFPIDCPGVFGHEGVGTVIELGKCVRRYQLGDRVLRPCAIYPDQTIDGLGSCWGSYAEYGLVTDLETWREEEPQGNHDRFWYARLQRKVPASFSPAQASLLITWKETYSALRALGDVRGKCVAVVGDGCVGLSFCRWAKVLNAARVTVLGRRDFRLQRAQSLGADQIIHTRRDRLPETRSFDFIADTVGSSAIIQQMLPLLRDQGRIGVYGVGETFRLEFDRSQGPRVWSLVQINPDEAACHDEVIQWMQGHSFREQDFVTCVEPLERLPQALRHLEEPASLKSLIRL